MTDTIDNLPTTRTDADKLTNDAFEMPIIPTDVYQHVGRFAGALVMSCFEQIGGLPRMAQWADDNPTDFYTKLFPKMITRSSAVEVNGQVSLDDALTRLESLSPASVIEGVVSQTLEYDL